MAKPPVPSPGGAPKFKLFVLNWLCVFPLVVLLDGLFRRLLPGQSGYVITACVSATLVFGMTYFVEPLLQRVFRPWLRNK